MQDALVLEGQLLVRAVEARQRGSAARRALVARGAPVVGRGGAGLPAGAVVARGAEAAGIALAPGRPPAGWAAMANSKIARESSTAQRRAKSKERE